MSYLPSDNYSEGGYFEQPDKNEGYPCPKCQSKKTYKKPWLEMDRHLHEENEILMGCQFCGHEFIQEVED